jgi:hypothetical protein
LRNQNLLLGACYFHAGVREANEILAVIYHHSLHVHEKQHISFNSETLAAQEIQSVGPIKAPGKATRPAPNRRY